MCNDCDGESGISLAWVRHTLGFLVLIPPLYLLLLTSLTGSQMCSGAHESAYQLHPPHLSDRSGDKLNTHLSLSALISLSASLYPWHCELYPCQSWNPYPLIVHIYSWSRKFTLLRLESLKLVFFNHSTNFLWTDYSFGKSVQTSTLCMTQVIFPTIVQTDYFTYNSLCQQHTTLHTTAGLLLKLSKVGPVQSLDGRPDAAGSGVGGPVGGTLSSG